MTNVERRGIMIEAEQSIITFVSNRKGSVYITTVCHGLGGTPVGREFYRQLTWDMILNKKLEMNNRLQISVVKGSLD